MDAALLNPKNRTLKLKVNDFLLALLCLAVFAVFMNPSLQIITGPIIAVLLTYLYFMGNPEIVTAVVLVANDALGTVIFGSLSFQYLLLGMAAVR